MHLHDLPDRVHVVPSHESVLKRQETFGYTHEDLKLLVAPMARTGGEALGSMGTDTPDRGALHPLAHAVRLLPAAVRAGHQPAARRHPRGARHLAVVHHRVRGQPARTRPAVVRAGGAAVPDHRQRRAGQAHPHRPRRRPPRVRRRGGVGSLPRRRRRARAARGPRPRARGGVGRHRRRQAHPRAVRPRLRRRERADPVVAPHLRGAPPPHPREDPHARRPRGRDRRRPRGAPHGAARRVRRGRDQPVPRVRVDRGPHRRGAARPHGHGPQGRDQELHQGRGQGRAQGDVEDGHLHRRLLLRRAGVRGHRSEPGAGRRVLHRHRVAPRRHRPRRARDRSGQSSRDRVRRTSHRAGPPRPRARRRVPVAARGRVPPLQPRDRLQAAARDARRSLRRLQGVHRAGRLAVDQARHAARPVRAAPGRAGAGADRRGRAHRVDRQALRHRRDVVRLHLQGSARDPRHRDEPHRRQVQHRRGRRRRRSLHPRRQRRPAPLGDQAGGVGSLRRHVRVPGQRRRPADQDGPGRQAGRGRSAAGVEGLPVDRQDPELHAGRGAHQPAAAPRHLLDRRHQAAHPRPQELQPAARACT